MNIPVLPLAFIGWSFLVLCFAALAIGVALLRQLFRGGRISPEYLRTRIVGDIVLLLIWLLGFASAFGVLNGLPWSRTGLEYFCWVLIVLTLLSGGTRLAAHARRTPRGRPRAGAWVLAVAGVMLVAMPLIVLCGVSIHTLRSDPVRLIFEQKHTR